MNRLLVDAAAWDAYADRLQRQNSVWHRNVIREMRARANRLRLQATTERRAA